MGAPTTGVVVDVRALQSHEHASRGIGRYTLELIRAVRREVTVPVNASGGAGAVEHFPRAVEAGADAVLAATVFHFGTLRIADVKHSLAAAGYPVR